MQTTIYIRKENEAYWDSLPDKSIQVNHWLEVARQTKPTTETLRKGVAFKPASLEPVVRIDATSVLIPKSERFNGPLCKIHGTPLDDRGKCLMKGCKYA